jgi:acetone carboxylase gamma subunit
MNQKEQKQLAIAYSAIRGDISWPEAARKMGVTRVHDRICALLRKEYQEKVKYDV